MQFQMHKAFKFDKFEFNIEVIFSSEILITLIYLFLWTSYYINHVLGPIDAYWLCPWACAAGNLKLVTSRLNYCIIKSII